MVFRLEWRWNQKTVIWKFNSNDLLVRTNNITHQCQYQLPAVHQWDCWKFDSDWGYHAHAQAEQLHNVRGSQVVPNTQVNIFGVNTHTPSHLIVLTFSLVLGPHQHHASWYHPSPCFFSHHHPSIHNFPPLCHPSHQAQMAFWAAHPLRPMQVSIFFRTYIHTPPWGIFHSGFAAALPSALKTLQSWEPNEARPSMLKEYCFVFVHKKGLKAPAGISGGGGVWQSRIQGIHCELWCSALAKDTCLG